MVLAHLLVLAMPAFGQAVQLKTATHHAMEYYISLPDGWSPTKKWPVVVAIESAERDFKGTAELFAKARKKMPFIIVVPLVVTNGGSGYRTVPSYHYMQTVWSQIDRIGEYAFDLAGIEAVGSDVRKTYSGDSRFYLTGFEAGCHTLFAVTFRHPEWLLASVPTSPNYRGRGMEDGAFSKSPSRAVLPLHEIHGSADAFSDPGKPFYAQWQAAKSAATAHGFGNVSEQIVAGKGHVWLADDVLEYCSSLIRKTP